MHAQSPTRSDDRDRDATAAPHDIHDIRALTATGPIPLSPAATLRVRSRRRDAEARG